MAVSTSGKSNIVYVTAYGTAPTTNRNYTEDYDLTVTADLIPVLACNGATHVGWYTTNTFDNETLVGLGSILKSGNDNEPTYLYAKWELDKVLVTQMELYNIADGLRTLSGETGGMLLSEMSGKIDAANAAVDAALAALTEKEVEVADGAGVGELAGLIRGIEAGGSVKTGRVTLRDTDNLSYIYYMNSSGEMVSEKAIYNAVYEVLVPSIIYFGDSRGGFDVNYAGYYDRVTPDNSCTFLYTDSTRAVIWLHDNFQYATFGFLGK